MSVRASKRRKLDAAALPEGSSASAKLAELRRYREIGRGVNGGDSTTEQHEEGAAAAAHRTQTRARNGSASGNGETGAGDQINGEHKSSTTVPKARRSSGKANGEVAMKTGGRKPTRPAVSTEGKRDEGKPDEGAVAGQNGTHGTFGGDIDMQDAPSVTADSKEGSVDLESRRTSGRKRQISRKLEEAQLATTPARSSPAARLRTTQERQTPNGTTGKAKGMPASAPRSGRSSATKKKVLPAEIPESESDTETSAVAEMEKTMPDLAERRMPTKAIGLEGSVDVPTPATVPDPPHLKKTVKKRITAVHSAPIVESDVATPNATKRSTKRPETAPPDLVVAEDEEMPDVVADEGLELEEDQLRKAKTAVLRRLTRKPPSGHEGAYHPLVGLDAEYQKVAGMVEQTVTAGESNSMVLIGARGSGKSALVDNVIREQQVSHASDFHVVRLSGFVHTDDKIAIREIWRQLGREMEIDDDSLVKNYADTLTTLLALLSHPSETGQETQGRMAKSVIIILDEFDLFTHHPRQTLLYNLFDIAQSRKAPIAVLGLTTRFDVAEALEKRVKSRFSHRQTYLPLARTFAVFKSMCQAQLTFSGPSFNTWNTLITTLFTTSNPLSTLLLQTYHTTKSVSSFLTALYLPFASLPTSPMTLASLTAHLDSHLTHAPSLSPPGSLLSLLPSLSTLQLSLLISAARLVIIHDSDTISFPLAYDEYKSLASKARIAASASGALATGQGARVWGVRVARMAWEGLVEKGLVVEDGVGGGRGAGRVDVSLEEIGGVLEGGGVEGVGGGMVRWCREI